MDNDFIMIPVEQAENPAGTGGTFTFPAGPWTGKIDTVRSRGIPTDSSGRAFSGYSSTDGEVFGLQLGNNEPGDGQDEVGATKMFVDIAISDGDLDLSNVDITTRDAPFWQLQRSAKLFVNLAIALDAADMIEANGSSVWSVGETFVEDLRSGKYDGVNVGFEVGHTTSKKNGKTYANVVSFFLIA